MIQQVLNGEEVTSEIRSFEVNQIVSPISSIVRVRLKMVDLQRKMAEGKDVIMEGRDIGTYVFPKADVKIYLDADVEERAKRRFKENQEKGLNVTFEEVLENIKKRDEVEEISLIPIPGKDWWEEYRACEQDDIVTFCPEEADIEYSDYSVKKDCITAIYKRASYACGLFYRLIIKGAEEFDPSKLKVSNPVDGSDYCDIPDAFYDGNQLVYLGNGFDDSEFEYSTARLFWDGEEIELPEMDNGYDDEEEDW